MNRAVRRREKSNLARRLSYAKRRGTTMEAIKEKECKFNIFLDSLEKTERAFIELVQQMCSENGPNGNGEVSLGNLCRYVESLGYELEPEAFPIATVALRKLYKYLESK